MFVCFAGVQRWTAEDRDGQEVALEYNARVQHIGVSAPGRDPVYFVAPSSYSHSCIICQSHIKAHIDIYKEILE